MKFLPLWITCLLPLSLGLGTIAQAQDTAQPYPQELILSLTQSCVNSLQLQRPTTPAPVINSYCQCNVEQMQRTIPVAELNALGQATSSRRPLSESHKRTVALLNQNVDACARQQGLKPDPTKKP